MGFRNRSRLSFIVLTLVMGLLLIFGAPLFASDGESAAASAGMGSNSWALIAAAVAFGFGALGAGYAISHVGAAAMGAIGEKPEIASQALIFIALAEGLVVFGFITALMILGKA